MHMSLPLIGQTTLDHENQEIFFLAPEKSKDLGTVIQGIENLPLQHCNSGASGGAVDGSDDWEGGHSEEGFGDQ